MSAKDYLTLLPNVLIPVRSKRTPTVTLRAFDHRLNLPPNEQPIPIECDTLVIVEGLFLYRPELREYGDMSIFLDVPFAVSVAHLAACDGGPTDSNGLTVQRCIQDQRVYFVECPPQDSATFVIGNF